LEKKKGPCQRNKTGRQKSAQNLTAETFRGIVFQTGVKFTVFKMGGLRGEKGVLRQCVGAGKVMGKTGEF